jgi:hypothetical protein
MVGGLGLRGERIPRAVGRTVARGYFSGARGTRFWLGSAELTSERRFGLRIAAWPSGCFRLRWAVPRYINRANKHNFFGSSGNI